MSAGSAAHPDTQAQLQQGAGELQLDAQVRAAALAPTRSLLLQAPAGSGKTTVLAARFLTLLATVDEPEQILAITFTRKAAAEMRHRILSALQGPDATGPGLPASLSQAVRERDAQRGWNLLHNPARLRVDTIDALNGYLARSLPVSARCAPTLQIALPANALYELAARRTLASAWKQEQLQAAVHLLLERLDNQFGRLQRLLAEMLSLRSHWLPRVLDASAAGLVQRVHAALDSLIRAQLALARAGLSPELLQEGERLLRELGGSGHDGAPCALDAQASSLPHWRALCQLVLTKEGRWRRSLDIRQGVAPADKQLKQRVLAWIEVLARRPGARELLRELMRVPDARLSDTDEQALDALAQLLVAAAAQLQIVFADSGRVDFPYVAAAARTSLIDRGEPSELGLRAGNALRHILVDEFQDTSHEQFRLLEALSAPWESGDGRTLFVVGDPMQSIYQFREADVGLFLQARDQGIGALELHSLRLRCNFRARAALLDWINASFAGLFPAEDDARLAAIRYAPSVSAPVSTAQPLVGEPLTLHRFDFADRLGEAQTVVEIVLATRGQAPSASIAVLVLSREHATCIAAALRTAGIPLQGVDLEPLRERPVIRDLSALTRALLHRADRTAWLALLRAPWCALTLAQLSALRAPAGADLFDALRSAADAPTPDDDAQSAADAQTANVADVLARLCAALAPALHGRERNLPLWRRVEHCWLRLAGPAIYPGSDDRTDARRFIDALAVHEAPENLAGETLQALLDPLYSAAPPEPHAVQIMTVHAAKGLEWDVVILPQLGRQTTTDADPLLHWIELPRLGGEMELLLAPIRTAAKEPAASLGAYIKRLRSARLRLERVRLLYVAATRARQALHLLGALRPGSKGELHPARGSPLELLWPVIGAEFAALVPRSAASTSAQQSAPSAGMPAASAARPLLRLASAWSLPAPPPAPQPLRLQLPAAEAGMRPEYSWVGLAARAVGTIVHAELHRLSLAAQLPPAVAVADEHTYEPWLAELGVEPHQRSAAAARIIQALRRTLAETRGRWLLSSEHREARSEWRLSGIHEGRVLNVIFDRMLVDEQGQRWIVDFKTGTHEGGALELFLDAEVQRYRQQLLRYAALARSLGPEPVRVALYFPLLGEFREVTVGASSAPGVSHRA